ncbi:hypothetical protein FKM82_027771 [Ascaphus truei]
MIYNIHLESLSSLITCTVRRWQTVPPSPAINALNASYKACGESSLCPRLCTVMLRDTLPSENIPLKAGVVWEIYIFHFSALVC